MNTPTLSNKVVDTQEVDPETKAWAWLTGMVESICDEAPEDIAYTADQMVDAFMAGQGRALRTTQCSGDTQELVAPECRYEYWRSGQQWERGECFLHPDTCDRCHDTDLRTTHSPSDKTVELLRAALAEMIEAELSGSGARMAKARGNARDLLLSHLGEMK